MRGFRDKWLGPGIAAVFALAIVFAGYAFGQGVGPNVTNLGQYGQPFTSQGSHWISGGGLPPSANAGCGTGATVIGTDSVFQVITGTGTSPGTDCLMTFAQPWNDRPTCIVQSQQNAVTFFDTPSTLSLHSVVDTSRYHVHCIGRAGG